MKLVIVGNEKGCPLCRAALTALTRSKLPYRVIDTFSPEGSALLQANDLYTIPSFFDGTSYLGNYHWFLKEGYSAMKDGSLQ